MIPLSGKAKKIREQILGTPPNEHLAYSRDPRIRDSDIKRVTMDLMSNSVVQAMNVSQPQEGMQ